MAAGGALPETLQSIVEYRSTSGPTWSNAELDSINVTFFWNKLRAEETIRKNNLLTRLGIWTQFNS